MTLGAVTHDALNRASIDSSKLRHINLMLLIGVLCSCFIAFPLFVIERLLNGCGL